MSTPALFNEETKLDSVRKLFLILVSLVEVVETFKIQDLIKGVHSKAVPGSLLSTNLDMTLVTPTDALARKQRGWLHVDVRPQTEFSRARFHGSLNIPYEATFLARARFVLKKTDKIIICCRDGNLCGKTTVRLTAQGYRNIVVMCCGITAWKASGFPVYNCNPHLLIIESTR